MLRASLTLWSVIIIPIFIFLSNEIVDLTSSIAIGSIPAKGSSSKRNFGLLANALAISVLLLSPPDNNLPLVCLKLPKENCLIRLFVISTDLFFLWNRQKRIS